MNGGKGPELGGLSIERAMETGEIKPVEVDRAPEVKPVPGTNPQQQGTAPVQNLGIPDAPTVIPNPLSHNPLEGSGTSTNPTPTSGSSPSLQEFVTRVSGNTPTPDYSRLSTPDVAAVLTAPSTDPNVSGKNLEASPTPQRYPTEAQTPSAWSSSTNTPPTPSSAPVVESAATGSTASAESWGKGGEQKVAAAPIERKSEGPRIEEARPHRDAPTPPGEKPGPVLDKNANIFSTGTDRVNPIVAPSAPPEKVEQPKTNSPEPRPEQSRPQPPLASEPRSPDPRPAEPQRPLEVTRSDSPKNDAPRNDVPRGDSADRPLVRPEQPRTEQLRPEQPRLEQPRAEPPRTDQTRPEMPRPEIVRPETVGPEQPRVETQRPDPAPVVPARPSTTPTELPRPASPSPEQPRAELQRPEPPRVDPPRVAPTRVEAPPTETPKSQQAPIIPPRIEKTPVDAPIKIAPVPTPPTASVSTPTRPTDLPPPVTPSTTSQKAETTPQGSQAPGNSRIITRTDVETIRTTTTPPSSTQIDRPRDAARLAQNLTRQVQDAKTVAGSSNSGSSRRVITVEGKGARENRAPTPTPPREVARPSRRTIQPQSMTARPEKGQPPNQFKTRKTPSDVRVVPKGSPVEPRTVRPPQTKIPTAAPRDFIPVKNPLARYPGAPKPELPLALARSIEAVTSQKITKQEAMKALVGLVIEADKATSRVVAEVKVETASKLNVIQGQIDELLKLRVEQFSTLSLKKQGVDQSTVQQLLHESLQELATRYGLTDEQRQLLNRVLVAVTNLNQEQQHDQQKQKPPDKDTEPSKDKGRKELRVATPEEIAKARREEIDRLQEMLKERDDIRRARAEEELKRLLEAEHELDVSYMIDEDLEVVKVYRITGEIRDAVSQAPLRGVSVLGGLLGVRMTGTDGLFEYQNIPNGTVFLIGLDHERYRFKPSLVADTLTMSIHIVFDAYELRSLQ